MFERYIICRQFGAEVRLEPHPALQT